MILHDFTLDESVRRIVRPLVRVLCGREAEERGLIDRVVDHFELSLRSFPPFARTAMLTGLRGFEHTARLRPSSLGRPFSSLPLELQTAHFESYWSSPIDPLAQFAKGVKALLCMGYWEQPEVREAIGYRPAQWMAEVGARRREKWGAAIDEHEAMVRAPSPLVRR